MSAKRIRSFDALKFFGIFLVVWGHSIAWFTSNDANTMDAYVFIYSFHMPLFMAIAGFFSTRLIDKSPKEILLGRCWPLLVPTLTLGVAVSLVEWIVSGTPFCESLAMAFWFLTSLALCSLLFYVTMRQKKYRGALFFLGLLVSQAVPPFVRYDFNIAFMYPAFLLGVLLSWNFEWLKRNRYVIFIASLTCFVILLIFSSPQRLNPHFSSGLGRDGLMEFAFNYAYKMTTGLTGALASISFFEVMASVVPVSKIGDRFCAMGKDTLAIYILSGVIVHSFVVRFVQFDAVPAIFYQYLLTPLIAYATIEGCVLLARLIRKSHVLSFIVFGK